MATNWQEQRLREERSERIKEQEAKRDPELEQAVIAYHAHRVNGGQSRWSDFRIDWYKLNGHTLKVNDGR